MTPDRVSPLDAPSLVMVHLPKTAGTSFRASLREVFGDALREDYADVPLQRPRWERRLRAIRDAAMNRGRTPAAACIYGHFLPLKYRWSRNVRFGVWMRDPVQRVVSRYHHYVRAVAEGDTDHLRWGLKPGLSLEAFVRLPQYQDACAEHLWLFAPERFDFIGLVEHYEQDFGWFFRQFSLDPGRQARLNVNPSKPGRLYDVEPRMQRLIRALNPRDCALYARCTELRRELLARERRSPSPAL